MDLTRRRILEASGLATAGTGITAALAEKVKAPSRMTDKSGIELAAEELQENIARTDNEWLAEGDSIYTGNVNKHAEIGLTDTEIEISEVKDYIQDGYSAEEIFRIIDGVREFHRANEDKLEVPLLLENQANINLIEARVDGEPRADLKHVEQKLDENIPEQVETDFSTQRENIDKLDQETVDSIISRSENISKFENATLNLLMTDSEIENFKQNCSCVGYAYFDGNKSYVELGDKKTDNTQVERLVGHEATGHALFNLRHFYGEDDFMSQNPSSIGSSADPGKRSQLLMKSYLNSELELEITENKTLKAGFRPEKIEREIADEEFRNHFRTYLEDGLNFDMEEWEFEDYTVQRSEKDLDKDVIRYTSSLSEEDLEIEFKVGYNINQVDLRTY